MISACAGLVCHELGWCSTGLGFLSAGEKARLSTRSSGLRSDGHVLGKGWAEHGDCWTLSGFGEGLALAGLCMD
jgi:hypothetical protein